MTHPRKTIRDEIVSRLSGLAGGRVQAGRVYAVPVAPAILVYTALDQAEDMTISFGNDQAQQRTLVATIEVYSFAGSVGFEDEIDQIAEQIEIAMAPPIPGTQEHSYIQTTLDYSKDQKRAGGVARLEYQIRYITRAGGPTIEG